MKDIAFVVSYFNFCGYQRLKNNLLEFAKQFQDKARLEIVECAFFDKPFEIEGSLQCRSNSVLFQKERLLTLGAEKLMDEGYEKIVFCDGDVIFHTDGWAEKISRSLDRYKVVQAFSNAEMIFDDKSRPGWSAIRLFLDFNRDYLEYNQGLLWGVRAEVLKQLPIYQYCLLGNGDQALAIGSVKAFAKRVNWDKMLATSAMNASPMLRANFIEWSDKWSAIVGRSLGFTPELHVKTLPHGTLANRNYHYRHLLMKEFDPTKHVAYQPQGPFEWTEAASNDQREDIQSYFFFRQEDQLE